VKSQSDAIDAFQIQNSAGTALLVADTTAMKISVTGTTTTFASLTLTNAHFASTQTNPPTIGTPTNCGTTPSAVVAAGSTDTAGSFTITTGTGGTVIDLWHDLYLQQNIRCRAKINHGCGQDRCTICRTPNICHFVFGHDIYGQLWQQRCRGEQYDL
jgi:hypothetical protein